MRARTATIASLRGMKRFVRLVLSGAISCSLHLVRPSSGRMLGSRGSGRDLVAAGATLIERLDGA